MSETEDKIIQNLLEEEVKTLKASNEVLHKKSNWFSKEMIGIYSAIVAGVLAWGNTAWDTISHREEQASQKQESVEKRRRVDTTVLTYVDEQMEEVTGVCELYLDAVLHAMPSYQRRKAERFLDTEGDVPEEDDEGYEGRMPAPVAHSPSPPEPAHMVMQQETYKAILEAAEGGEIPIKELAKKRIRKLRKKR